MKIIKLQSENFKKLKAISITPTNNTVIISGKNGQGKTSVLDSIFAALAGKNKELLKPIREGEFKSVITLDLGKFTVIRTFKEGSTKLEVVNKDGEFMASPQTMLNELLGSLSFDPLEFSNKSQKEQRSLLLQLINIDLDSFTQKRKDLYDRRHEIGLEAKSYPEYTFQEQAEAEREAQKPLVDVAELTTRYTEAVQTHSTFEQAQKEIPKLKEVVTNQLERIEQLKTQIQALQRGIEETLDKVKVCEATQDTTEDIRGLQSLLNNADETNNKIRTAQSVVKDLHQIKIIKADYDALTVIIDKTDQELKETLEKAKMPIEGLGINEDTVTFNKIPFAQLSTSEKLKVSMAIAMAMNPELRVIRILDGSLLDEDNMKVIQQMAVDSDFQVWIEVVDSSGKVGIYIEDGEIVTVNETENQVLTPDQKAGEILENGMTTNYT